jgi:hypothetical protein
VKHPGKNPVDVVADVIQIKKSSRISVKNLNNRLAVADQIADANPDFHLFFIEKLMELVLLE